MTVPFSILDLAPIVEGSDARQALLQSRDLAQQAERWGYHRFWLAEHHGMPGVASAATSVVIAHVAAGTSRIRVGAGGIMLPNHAPLLIAEQFGTLEALYPGRIDLGLGRAPGSDSPTMRALRRSPTAADTFPQDVLELMGYFEPAEPGQPVRAVPGAGLPVPIWILGSSLYGAQFAAALGAPYAFASHFAPAALMPAIDSYRTRFRPSARLERPYLMLGVNVIAADTDEEAQLLFTSLQQAFINIRNGRPGPFPAPQRGFAEQLPPYVREGLDEMLACSVVGSPATVREGLADFIARTGADELMIATAVHDHRARLRSYEITAAAREALGAPMATSARSA